VGGGGKVNQLGRKNKAETSTGDKKERLGRDKMEEYTKRWKTLSGGLQGGGGKEFLAGGNRTDL